MLVETQKMQTTDVTPSGHFDWENLIFWTPRKLHTLPSLVGGWATPLKNMSSSIGMMTATQYFWEHKKWQPNHQPVMVPNKWFYPLLDHGFWGFFNKIHGNQSPPTRSSNVFDHFSSGFDFIWFLVPLRHSAIAWMLLPPGTYPQLLIVVWIMLRIMLEPIESD